MNSLHRRSFVAALTAALAIDPTPKPDGKGLIAAPVISFDECSAKFAG